MSFFFTLAKVAYFIVFLFLYVKLFLASSGLQYGSEIGPSSQGTTSTTRHFAVPRPDIDVTPSHHRTIRIENMEVIFLVKLISAYIP